MTREKGFLSESISDGDNFEGSAATTGNIRDGDMCQRSKLFGCVHSGADHLWRNRHREAAVVRLDESVIAAK